MSDNKDDKFRASYQFFLKMQNDGKTFSSDDIATVTGWSKSTVKTYRTKKWADILIGCPAILSIDIYNRPIASFRAQGYIVMMIIAWTALFHAIFEMEHIDYFYKEKDGSDKIVDNDKKAWELATCIEKCGSNL